MKCDYDLLIAGGGLVGGSLALALRGVGLRVGVIEPVTETQRQASSAGDRALALAWGSVQILDQLGVWRAAESKATPIKHIHVSDKGHFGKVRLSAEREGVQALGYVAVARVLEDEIAGALSRAAIDVLCPARVVGVKAGGEGIHVAIRNGMESINLTARLLVAADGGNSSIRSLLEIGQTVRDYGQTGVVVEVDSDRSNNFVAYERFTTAGPLALLPIGNRKSSVVWTQKHEDAHELLALPEAAFLDRLQSAFGYWLGGLRLASGRQGFPLKLIRAERMADQRAVLIGNAMHQLHPVAGQGFNLGLRDVALLAEMLAVRHEFGEDIGEKQFLERFAAARQDDLAQVMRFTDSMVRIFSNDFPPLSVARNIGLLALDHCQPVKRLLARHAMGLGSRIPRFG